MSEPDDRPGPPGPREIGRRYDEGADGYDARLASDPRTLRRFAILDEAQRAIARGVDRALEIGCGTGRLLATLEARSVIGVDVSAALLVRAKARRLVVARADAHALPFADGSFDAVLAGNAVFRYLDAARALAECARVLRGGGRLAVHQYAAHPWSPRRPFGKLLDGHPGHLRSLEELRRPARAAGLVEERVDLWRGLRLPPYLVRIPEPIAWRFWEQVTFVFRKPVDNRRRP